MDSNEICLSITINTKITEVWDALTQRNKLVDWLCNEANIDLVADGNYELFWNLENPFVESTLGCKILSLNEPNNISFTWKGPPQFAELFNNNPLPTFVEIELLGNAYSTVLILYHKGWQNSQEWLIAREWHIQVWQNSLYRLKEILESV